MILYDPESLALPVPIEQVLALPSVEGQLALIHPEVVDRRKIEIARNGQTKPIRIFQERILAGYTTLEALRLLDKSEVLIGFGFDSGQSRVLSHMSGVYLPNRWRQLSWLSKLPAAHLLDALIVIDKYNLQGQSLTELTLISEMFGCGKGIHLLDFANRVIHRPLGEK